MWRVAPASTKTVKTVIATTAILFLLQTSAHALPKGYQPPTNQSALPTIDGMEPCRNLRRNVVVRVTQAMAFPTVPTCPTGENTRQLSLDQQRRLVQGVYEQETSKGVEEVKRAINGR